MRSFAILMNRANEGALVGSGCASFSGLGVEGVGSVDRDHNVVIAAVSRDKLARVVQEGVHGCGDPVGDLLREKVVA